MPPFIGRVQYYVRLVMPQADGTRTCRLALCQVTEVQPSQQDLYVIKLEASNSLPEYYSSEPG